MSTSFGDEESVAEELEESLSESVDEEENYSDDNYSEDNYSFSASIPAVQTSAINLDDLVVAPPPPSAGAKDRGFPIKDENKDKTNTSADYDNEDDYSLSFDEDSDNNTAYSEEFDTISAMSMSRGSPAKQGRQGAHIVPKQQAAVSFQLQPQQELQPQPPPAPVLPSLALQSLQAENAMEKLSKEIVYLRNQQRIALKDRRDRALTKKRRAEERRQQHQADLVDAHQKAATLQVEKQSLEEKVRVLELSLVAAEEAKALSSAALEANNAVLQQQKEAMDEQQEQISKVKEVLSQREEEWAKKEADFASEMETVRKALLTAELHVSVMAKSNEAMEERLNRERSQLPALHQDLLDERLRHLAGIEESALRREEAAKCEQAAGALVVDNMRKELHAEVDRREVRLNAEIDAKREALLKAQEQLRFDMDKFSAHKAEEASLAEKKMLSLRREEQLVLERERVLAQRVTEFTVAKQVMEPELQAAERDREDAREQKRQSERVLQHALQQERRAEGQIEELQERERAVDRAWSQLERERAELHSTRSRVQVVARGSARDRSLLEEEREKLRGIAVGLTNQFHQLQKAALLLRARQAQKSGSQTLALPRERAVEVAGDDAFSRTVVAAMGQVATSSLLLERTPQYSAQELALELEEGQEGGQVALLVKGTHEGEQVSSPTLLKREEQRPHSPEVGRQHESEPRVGWNHSRADGDSDGHSHSHPRADISSDPGEESSRMQQRAPGNGDHLSNKSWEDSLEYSALSHALPPPPAQDSPPSSSLQLYHDNYSRSNHSAGLNSHSAKENVTPSAVPPAQHLQHHHHHHHQHHHRDKYAHSQQQLQQASAIFPPAPGCRTDSTGATGVGAVTQSAEALKSAARRFGVTIQ